MGWVENILEKESKLVTSILFFSHIVFNPLSDDKFYTLPNWNSLQMTISNLTKMAESYPNR